MTLAAGTKVSNGYYFNLGNWELTHVAQGALPGAGDRYLRLPMPLVLALAPMLGLAMVMFLPFIGFALTIGVIARKAADTVQDAFFSLAAVVHPAWRPGEAYLTGKRAEKDGEAKARDARLEALAGEIAARRSEAK